jgi:hypothetical protein
MRLTVAAVSSPTAWANLDIDVTQDWVVATAWSGVGDGDGKLRVGAQCMINFFVHNCCRF